MNEIHTPKAFTALPYPLETPKAFPPSRLTSWPAGEKALVGTVAALPKTRPAPRAAPAAPRAAPNIPLPVKAKKPSTPTAASAIAPTVAPMAIAAVAPGDKS